MQSLWSTRPHFRRLGVLSTVVLQYTVQKHEVFNGLLPQCVRIVKGFVMSWKACICIWFGNLFKSQTEYEDLCHTYTGKRGIHSSFVRRRSNFHARLVYWFMLRALTERTCRHVRGLVNFPEITVRPLCCVCLKMIMIIKSSCLHEKDQFQPFE